MRRMLKKGLSWRLHCPGQRVIFCYKYTLKKTTNRGDSVNFKKLPKPVPGSPSTVTVHECLAKTRSVFRGGLWRGNFAAVFPTPVGVFPFVYIFP